MIDILIFLGILSLISWAIFIFFVSLKFSKVQNIESSEVGELKAEIISTLGSIKKSDIEKIKEDAAIFGVKTIDFLSGVLKLNKKENKEMDYLKEKQEEKFKDSNYWKDIKNILKRKKN
jgi:hypothetical protein